MNKEMSRKGKHREEKTMLAAYISPDIKALAMLTQDRTGMSFTDMIVEGIRYCATQCGLIRNNELTDEAKVATRAIVDMLEAHRIEKKRMSH